jgi:hypothetical protein
VQELLGPWTKTLFRFSYSLSPDPESYPSNAAQISTIVYHRVGASVGTAIGSIPLIWIRPSWRARRPRREAGEGGGWI